MDIARIQDILPALIDALTDGVVVVDRERRVVAANRRYVDTFGDRRADLADSGCTESLHRDAALGQGQGRCGACEALDSGTALRRVRQISDVTGVTRRYEATFSPIFGPDGSATHVVEVWRDITDRSQLEVQLSHSERLASAGVLAAGVAHEINNPLASMMAGIDVLGRWLERGRFDTEGVQEARETIRMLEREIERARDTTGKLMLLGRSYDTAPCWVDVNLAVRDTLALLRYELRHRQIETSDDLDPDLPQVWAREAGIRGICMNLMLNAVQAMDAGGTLKVATRRGPERVTLLVEDTGPGISPSHLDRIWDPFFTTKPVGQGTGLGLSITSRIVSRHGGRITVDSAPGRGARFEVELPVHGTGGDG